MDGALKVLLLAALILLVTAQTFNNYRSLPDLYQVHIDKALKEANGKFGAGHHIAFHSLTRKPVTMKSVLNVNVILIITTCKKASKDAYKHRDECYERKQGMPIINCLVCTTIDNEELVDCGRRLEVRNGKHDEIRKKCRSYHTGGSSILAQQSLSEDNEQQVECSGCF